MKKKILTAALTVALLAVVVSGTLGYFAADDAVSNTLTMGSVYIEIWENGQPTDSETVTFDKPLVPVVDDNNPENDPAYQPKIVKIENTGRNSAYIRTHIAVPTALIGYLELDMNTEGWSDAVVTSALTGGTAYTVLSFDYLTAVAPGGFTTELLRGAYLRSEVDLKDNPMTQAEDLEFCKADESGGYTFSGYVAHTRVDGGYTTNPVCILVFSQAIQSQGFADAKTALDTGFGIHANPWQ